MSQGIEPMTAEEYRKYTGATMGLTAFGQRILAALEDREANLAHARLGSLVAAIREHKMFDCIAVFPRDKRDPLYGFPDANGLTNALAHLDSLLPKEPEPKWSGLAPSGGRYRVRGGLLYADDGVEMGQVARVGVEDIPFVAALLEASRAH